MKKPKYLYHGSRNAIKVLEPRKPDDPDPQLSKKAVYASSGKLGAIAHGIASAKSECFGERGNPIDCFVKGWPTKKTHKYSYVHILDSKDFKHNVKNEWIATKKVKPVRIEKYVIKDLKHLWRKSSKKELKEFLKDRDAWRIPKAERKSVSEIKKIKIKPVEVMNLK
jgi:hypothetical protein